MGLFERIDGLEESRASTEVRLLDVVCEHDESLESDLDNLTEVAIPEATIPEATIAEHQSQTTGTTTTSDEAEDQLAESHTKSDLKSLAVAVRRAYLTLDPIKGSPGSAEAKALGKAKGLLLVAKKELHKLQKTAEDEDASRFDELAGLDEAAPYVPYHASKSISGEFRGRIKKVQAAMGNASLRLDRLASAISHYNKGAGPGTPAEIKKEWGYVADALETVVIEATKAKRSALSWKKATKSK